MDASSSSTTSRRSHRPTLGRAVTTGLATGGNMSGGQRLRSRSLIQAIRIPPPQDNTAVTSGVSPLPSIEPSPLVASSSTSSESEPEFSSSVATEDSSPPATPTSTTSIGTRRRSTSLDDYSHSPLLKGKGKGDAYPPELAPRPKRKASWLAISVPFAPFEAPRLEHAHTDSVSSVNQPNQLGIYSLIQPIAILTGIFVASTVVVVFAISTVPTLAIPHDLSEVLEQGVALKRYSTGSIRASAHTISVLTVLFVYKQAFSIPGSLLTNILFGSLYGVFWSTVITSVLTAVGSLLCYLMAWKTSPLVRYFLPKPLAFIQKNIESRTQKSADLFSYLLLMRLFPLLPYAVLNIAGGVLGIPPSPFFWTLMLGSIPYNLVTCSVGDVLSSLPLGTAELSSIWTPALFAKLLLISTVSALPILFKSQIQTLLGGGPDVEAAHSDASDLEEEAIPLRGRKTASVIIEEHSDELEVPWQGLDADLERRSWVSGHENGWR